MNKEQAKERLCAIETEVEKLRRIIDEPEQRTPEEGDVWEGKCQGSILLLVDGDQNIVLENGSGTLTAGQHGAWTHSAVARNCTYLGKFDEVYIKISDVREALSIGTPGETFLEGRGSPAYDASREALRKLNIIKD